MARPARFERATAWFVARYSIQLSYGRVLHRDLYAVMRQRSASRSAKDPTRKFKSKVARPARFERATAWFVARYSIQLSYGRVSTRAAKRNSPYCHQWIG